MNKSYLAFPSDGSEAVTSNPSALCTPHFTSSGFGESWPLIGVFVVVGVGVFLQHTSMSFLQVVTLLSIWILTEFSKISSKISENPLCLISTLLVLLTLRTLFVDALISPEQS